MAANQPGGLFLLCCGVVASVAGLALVTNVRGFADSLARARVARITGIPFVIVGPGMIVIGIISISHGGIAMPGASALPSPFRYLFIAVAVAVVGLLWLPQRGFFRQAARPGGWRLAIALLASLGTLVFGVGIAFGQVTIAIAAWAIGGLPSLALWMEGRPSPPGSGDVCWPGSAAVVEGHVVAVGVGEGESAAERPVGGR